VYLNTQYGWLSAIVAIVIVMQCGQMFAAYAFYCLVMQNLKGVRPNDQLRPWS
jgi:hypothetical protein